MSLLGGLAIAVWYQLQPLPVKIILAVLFSLVVLLLALALFRGLSRGFR